MTDKEYLYVSTIAQMGSITKAAEALFIAQPSLTQALQRIEAEYGTSFFHRIRGGLVLSDAGKAYLHAAEKMLSLYQRMEDEIGAADKLYEGQVSLGITPVQGEILLPSLLSLCEKRFPKMKVKVTESTSLHLEKLAMEGRLDIAILHKPLHSHELNSITLYRGEILLAVSKQNRDWLAASRDGEEFPLITAELLANQQFNLLTANQRSRQVADTICAAAGIIPKINFTTTRFVSALALTEKGMGATFVPRCFAQYYSKVYPVSYFRLPRSWNPDWELVAIYSKKAPLSPGHLELVRIMQECIISMPEVFV